MRHIILNVLLAVFIVTGQTQNSISGKISWEDDQPMLFSGIVKVELLDFGGSVFGSFELPVENGMFATTGINHFINPLITANLRFSVSVEIAARANVTVFDIIRIKKYLLGLEPFTNALQVYAADVNSSESVSALDIVEIHKMILGLIVEWKNREVVHFFHRTTQNPPAIGSTLISEVVIPLMIGTDDYVVDFWAVKTGDVVR